MKIPDHRAVASAIADGDEQYVSVMPDNNLLLFSFLQTPHIDTKTVDERKKFGKIPKKCQICAKTNFSSVYGIGKRYFSEGEAKWTEIVQIRSW